MTAKKKIKEAIIVEGRDDTAAIRRAVDAMTIETHGFGMPAHIWPIIEKAAREQGIIVFTDPDYAGEKIRRKITERYPQCRHAFLPRGKALKNGDIGVENASPEDIIEALEHARCTTEVREDTFTEEDMFTFGLAGTPDARQRREKLGDMLSIGYGNAGTFLRRLNQFGVSREDFMEKIKELEQRI
ncbi:MAG: ribonuclease M5 [Emergencia sp.]